MTSLECVETIVLKNKMDRTGTVAVKWKRNMREYTPRTGRGLLLFFERWSQGRLAGIWNVVVMKAGTQDEEEEQGQGEGWEKGSTNLSILNLGPF